jgi:hypothetical protein
MADKEIRLSPYLIRWGNKGNPISKKIRLGVTLGE